MGDISVILNVYKRPHTLEKQIESIKNQTIKVGSDNIHVWYNPVEGVIQDKPKDSVIKTYESSYNTKFFGRFTIPLICKTKYIAIFDDDIIPGEKWLENCIKNINLREGILGGSGVITNGRNYVPNEKIGWNGLKNLNQVNVDLVGHAWFFKKKHAKFMWLEEPPSWENGEDMFFSYVAQKNGIPTYVPPHPPDKIEMWSNDFRKSKTNGVEWGVDDNAHSLVVSNHMQLRNNIVTDLKNRGWSTVRKNISKIM